MLVSTLLAGPQIEVDIQESKSTCAWTVDRDPNGLWVYNPNTLSEHFPMYLNMKNLWFAEG